MEIKINSLEALPRAAAEFIRLTASRKVIAFVGEMGAGKTTFIAEVCRQSGVSEIAASPSFAIINEYRGDASHPLIYHFDFYRLDTIEDAMEIGTEDYFYSGNLCLIEWPERVESLLPDDTLVVRISVDHLTATRTISLEL